ncbi:rRNA biogenesis protein Nop56/Nop58 [Desulfurococcus mucosus]|uniref:rRNA biogenesis protein Nop56/Nop58 n=1 Tax=Desulfurococcus mucosus (strain ATCC 35584 / DSM 2162 / JCM 9187 / O7/1) TaxID=765177 RepID=E8R9J4_DESM0|nr:rRNA biogenesis protein Nop56/Nop58 [Desulfurococcus mucosus]ADV65170.1 rRNA biogenesis protein Nop56/Nop58 [Desulfurococcus mucosus DSM 2162]
MGKAYIVESVIGVIALNDEGSILVYARSPESVDDTVEYLLNIERGESTPQHSEVLGKLKELGVANVVVESLATAKIASAHGLTPEVVPGGAVFVKARDSIQELAVKVGFVDSPEKFFDKLHEIMLEYTRRKLRREAQKRDLLAVQAIRAIDDIDKTINLYVARLREWYSIHFPELDELVKEHPEYAKLVYELGDRSNYTVENLVKLGYGREKAEKLADAARSSIGADLSDFDMNYIKVLAGIILDLYRLRDTLDEYIDAVMKEVAPNIAALVGPKLGARLLSLAGGLEKLAKLPASTIQVLGAEKALFRALRTGGKPPKHGVIFQHPHIHKSPRWQRGKIARALAAKLSIAAKVDYFSGRLVGDKLVKEFEERVEEIKKLYPKPPPRKEEEKKPKPPHKFKKKGGR